MSGTSFHAFNPYLGGYSAYKATFNGTLSSKCTIGGGPTPAGTWTSTGTQAGLFDAYPLDVAPTEKLILSGKVTEGQPGQPPKPVAKVGVAATGASGSGHTTTAADGTYTLHLPKGVYDVSVAHASSLKFEPATYTVNLHASRGGVDFTGTLSCAASLSGALRYATGQTVIDYRVSDLSTRCGPADVSLRLGAQVEGAARQLSTSTASEAGSFVIDHRLCRQFTVIVGRPGDSNHEAEVRLGEDDTDGTVIYASGDVTGPDGETLRTGDPLCGGENGAGYTFGTDVSSTQQPRLPQDFKKVAESLERTLKLHVGSDGALWFDIGGFSLRADRGDEKLCGDCTVAGGPTVTPGVLDVPAAHIKVIGVIAGRRLVLGLGNGRTVSLKTPNGAPSELSEGTPVAGEQRLTQSPVDQGEFAGFVDLIPTRTVVLGRAALNGAVLYAFGSADFEGGLAGDSQIARSSGAVIAQGDITVQGPVDLETDDLIAFLTRGTVSLLGTR